MLSEHGHFELFLLAILALCFDQDLRNFCLKLLIELVLVLHFLLKFLLFSHDCCKLLILAVILVSCLSKLVRDLNRLGLPKFEEFVLETKGGLLVENLPC